jgi:hypothetical protein
VKGRDETRRRNLDREKTQMQGWGDCYIDGLTLAEAWEIVTDLGIDPTDVKFSPRYGGQMYVTEEGKRAL